MLYGANGTTGRLFLEVWHKSGTELPPCVLAGRSAHALRSLAEKYNLPYQTFTLDELPHLSLQGAPKIIVNFAGPYAYTARPWLDYCLRKGIAYMDISGEWRVLADMYAQQEAFREAGVPVIPSAGFDTVIGEGAVYAFRQKYPQARALHLGIYARGGYSAGTVRSALVTLPHGYFYWERGALRPVGFSGVERRLANGKVYHFWRATLAELVTLPAWMPDLEALHTWVALPPRYMRWRPFLEKVFAWQPFMEGILGLVDTQRARLAREMDLEAPSCTFVEAPAVPEWLYVASRQPYVLTAWAVLQSLQLFFGEGAAPGVQSAFGRWKEKLWEGIPGLQTLWKEGSSPA